MDRHGHIGRVQECRDFPNQVQMIGGTLAAIPVWFSNSKAGSINTPKLLISPAKANSTLSEESGSNPFKISHLDQNFLCLVYLV